LIFSMGLRLRFYCTKCLDITEVTKSYDELDSTKKWVWQVYLSELNVINVEEGLFRHGGTWMILQT
jgi:hypothetical protein